MKAPARGRMVPFAVFILNLFFLLAYSGTADAKQTECHSELDCTESPVISPTGPEEECRLLEEQGRPCPGQEPPPPPDPQGHLGTKT
jgi:hypothetical protein